MYFILSFFVYKRGIKTKSVFINSQANMKSIVLFALFLVNVVLALPFKVYHFEPQNIKRVSNSAIIVSIPFFKEKKKKEQATNYT
jgi:hypothetical protein